MNNLFIILLIASIFAVNSSKAQTAPVAVNDTFNLDYSDTAKVHKFNRASIIANDSDVDGNVFIIDTFSYNGVNQVQAVYYSSGLSYIRIKEINYSIPAGFFGKDSITYYLTDNGVPTGYDTATIYINVERQYYEHLNLNNINARVDHFGLFYDRANGTASFEAPKGNNTNTIFASNFWFAGIDPSGQLKGYADTYVSNNPVGNSGPIMDGPFYENYSYEWDRVWKVSDIHIQNHVSGIYTTEAISNWPAHGDTTKGQAFNLAPFVDVDFDGIYNPLLGDYPKIKGQQAIYFIRNAQRSAKFSIYMIPITSSALEFHGMVYAYDCPEDSAINNTIFVDYTIYNRSSFTFTDCYFGQWVDFDLGGNPGDDYVGSDVSRGTFYGYNGDNNDENTNGMLGYGVSPPAQGVTFLKGAQSDNDGVDNPLTTDIPVAIAQNGIPYAGLGIGFGDGTIDNEYLGLSHFMSYNIGSQINGNGDPANGADAYNYMKGKWANGNSMVWGGDGNPLGSGTVGLIADFMFPGDSDPLYWGTNGIVPTPATWSESTAGNTPNDRRGVGSTGPFTLLAGESAEIEVAFVFGRDYFGSDNLASIVVMQERVDSIRSYHANGFATTPCGGAILSTKKEVIEVNTLNIYPNPFANQFLVNYQPSLNTKVEVFNLLGGKVLTQQITNHLTLLDLSNQPNGVYFVRVIDGKDVLTKKVVKQ